MTTTTRIEPGGYAVEAVPATETNQSRYELNVLPAGWPSEGPAATVAHIFGGMVEDRVRAAEAMLPPTETVRGFAIAPQDGTLAIVPRSRIIGIPTKAKTRPSRFPKGLKLEDGALLDSAFRGEAAYEAATDKQLWEAALAFCIRTQPSPKVRRELNDALLRLVCLRAGLVVRPDKLPAVGAPHVAGS